MNEQLITQRYNDNTLIGNYMFKLLEENYSHIVAFKGKRFKVDGGQTKAYAQHLEELNLLDLRGHILATDIASYNNYDGTIKVGDKITTHRVSRVSVSKGYHSITLDVRLWVKHLGREGGYNLDYYLTLMTEKEDKYKAFNSLEELQEIALNYKGKMPLLDILETHRDVLELEEQIKAKRELMPYYAVRR